MLGPEVLSFQVARSFMLLLVMGLIPVLVSAQDRLAGVLKLEQPVFPEEANRVVIDGEIEVSLLIDKRGRPKNLYSPGPPRSCSGLRDGTANRIAELAKKAVLSSTFEHAMRSGKPTKGYLTVKFDLDAAESTPLVDIGDVTRKAVSLPPPRVDIRMLGRTVGGVTRIKVWIRVADGNVIAAQPSVEDDPTLVHSAMEAACNARFPASLVDGKGAIIRGSVTYTFTPPGMPNY